MSHQSKFVLTLTAVAVLVATGSVCAHKSTITNPFGDHVFINPSQALILETYKNADQFSDKRIALLFTPGSYDLDVRVGYNTQVIGLGESPDDVTIIGAVRTQDTPGSWDQGPGALNNFWRSAENLSILPTLGSITYPPGNKVVIPANQNVWAVSQAAPLRRIHIRKGDLRLFELGWSSGGFMANSKIDGIVQAGSQQQWYTRNSEWGVEGWLGGAWNMVLANNKAPEPAGSAGLDSWPNFPFTWIPQLPVSVDKPFLTYSNNEWAVLVPHAVQNPKAGIDWLNKGNRKTWGELYIAKPVGHGGDDAASINEALSNGKSIVLTPGEYNLNESLTITNPDTVILGLGLPTLNATGTGPAIKVADVDGVRLAGFTVDAGQHTANTTLIEIGAKDSHLNHANNPTALLDVYCRVGGEHDVKVAAQSCLTVNSSDVIGDNLWLWRADHDTNYPVVVPYNINPADSGIIINGDRVIMQGLAVEHFLKYQTVWNGDYGQLFFYQSEMPYDVPPQWGHNGVQGYAALQVNAPSSFTAYGVGVYSYFANTPQPVYADSAIEAVTKPGIHFEHLFSVYLNGDKNNPDVKSGIKHIINQDGEEENAAISTYTDKGKKSLLGQWSGAQK